MASQKNPKIDAYLENAALWQAEMRALREILINCDLIEDLKWAKPCYAYENTNIIVIIPFKTTCALLFMKGALLEDPDGLLVKAGENSEAGRQMRFNSVDEVARKESAIKAFVKQAVAIEKAGLKVKKRDPSELDLPEELQEKFDMFPEFKKAFEALTPGRQRAYIFYFASAKQSATRTARVEKYIPVILSGKGMND